ncbi:hypothetical protein JYT72_00965 [Crocinitomix catalasitica]|nr:hypothetical protein [Crocinitomix catalasitica]
MWGLFRKKKKDKYSKDAGSYDKTEKGSEDSELKTESVEEEITESETIEINEIPIEESISEPSSEVVEMKSSEKIISEKSDVDLTPDQEQLLNLTGHDSLASFKKTVQEDDWDDYEELFVETFSELEDEEKLPKCRVLLEEIGKQFDSYKIKYDKEDDSTTLQLRGRCKGFPVKVEFDWDDSVDIVCKVNSNIDYLYLEYDYEGELADKKIDPDDDFSDEDEARLFLIDKLYFEEDSQREIDEQLAYWDKLSESLKTNILRTYQKGKYHVFYIGGNEIEFDIWDIEDDFILRERPVSMITDMIDLMVNTAIEINVR